MRRSGTNLLLAVLTGAGLVLAAPASGGTPYHGFTLYSPNDSKVTYLIDMNDAVVHSWTHTLSGGYSCYLLEDGTLLRSANSGSAYLNGGGATGVIQKIAPDGTVNWAYTYSSSTYRAHHDIEPMPNGNVLLIAWETKTAAQAVAAGLNHSSAIWPDEIIEVQPSGTTGGTIVWAWHAWDHLIQDYNSARSNYGVVADHPELLDINVGSGSMGMGGGDWMHVNAVSYDPTLDQIAISSHNLDEIYVIDHSTTTAEAATHAGGNAGRGGDFLYRWGCPSNYDAPGSQVFDVVHCAWWIPEGYPGEGHLMAFNNRETASQSQIVELELPSDGAYGYTWTAGTAYGPTDPDWSYTASGFYSQHLGGVQRLPNGNTLIAESTAGRLFEVDADGNTVWEYAPGGEIVRALRYGPAYAGIAALGITADTGEVTDGTESVTLAQNVPNPCHTTTTIRYTLPVAGPVSLKVYDLTGRMVATLVDATQEAGTKWVPFDGGGLRNGIYFYRLRAGQQTVTRKLVLER